MQMQMARIGTRTATWCAATECAPTLLLIITNSECYRVCKSAQFLDGLLVAPITVPQNNMTELATRELWLPPGSWIDTNSGTEFRSSEKGRYLKYSATYVQSCFVQATMLLTCVVIRRVWEMPVFAKAGCMLPLGLQPGVSLDSFDTDLAQSAIGSAAREPSLLSWEVWAGSATSGQGHVWEESRGLTNVSFTLTDSTTLTLRVRTQGDTKRRHRFELQNLPPASSVHPCTSSTEYEEAMSTYDGRALALNVHITVHTGIEGGCVAIKFAQPLNSGPVASARAMQYRTLRSRMHKLKARFDDLVPRPGTFLMPIVAATNTADRLPSSVVIKAQEISTWAQQLTKFDGLASQALTSIKQWAVQERDETKKVAANMLMRTATAWICTGAAGKFDFPSCD
jgi:hypothetical protein